MTFDEIYNKVKRAITLEIKYQYIDFDGRTMNFSKFMINILQDILRRINKTKKNDIYYLITLFESYKVDSITNRKFTIDKTLETFLELRRLIKPKATEKKEEEKEQKNSLSDIDITYIKGIGPNIAKLLYRIGIFKVKDLIEYYPKKYIDYKGQKKIKDLVLGENVTLIGTIFKVSYYTTKTNLTIFTVYIKDSTGFLGINIFLKTKNRKLIEHYKKLYPINCLVSVLGKVKFDDYSCQTTLDKAQIQVLGKSEEIIVQNNKLMPVYSLCEGLNPKILINAIKNTIEKYEDRIIDPIPDAIRKKLGLIDKKDAVKKIHNPKTLDEKEQARMRLVFEEFFLLELNLAIIRKENEKNKSIQLKSKKGGLVEKFINNLPFKLTKGQEKALFEIKQDLGSSTPMQRLLQGDVGSGKTVVACIMLLYAIENGYQGAIMAPTEILAQQHYKNFCNWLIPLGLSVGLFVGKNSSSTKKEMETNLKNGQIHIAVGTHALIQEGVEFNNLGAVVVDEQHRFGVKQRNALLNKGKMPQMLNMTATPIPRTLSLTLHGDLDLTTIDELPKGRKPIITTLTGQNGRNQIYELIKKEIFFKHQAYIVYPLIEESETISAQAATLEAKKLQEGVFSNYRIGLLHGKMSGAEKDKIMEEFIRGNYDILVSTTVVEVGVDNPNATVIVIENAERFGLSQLHQLRGRVGRSDNQSYCALVLSKSNPDIKNRLRIMTETNNGFVISEHDLKLRGPGEFLGTRQSGLPDFNLADLTLDKEILETARKEAFEFINNNDINSFPYLKSEAQNYSFFKA